MKKYVLKIKEETGVKVTFEKDTVFEGYQHIVVDIPSIKVLAQIMKVVDTNLVIQQQYDRDDKYATIKIYDDYIE